MLQLDLGCGKNLKPGFIGVDIRELPGITHCCNSWEIGNHISPGSANEIYSRYLLQYLTLSQTAETLKSCNQILKPGGIIQIIVPDYRYWAKKFTNETSTPEELQSIIENIWGHQREGLTQSWDIAKSGYDFKILSGLLLKANFKTIFRVNEDRPWDLNVMAQKRGPQEEEAIQNDIRQLKAMRSSK